MSNYVIEGESFFVLKEIQKITKNKKVEINPEKTSRNFSFFSQNDFSIYYDPEKATIETLTDNFIVCFMDKNIDLRLDYIKKIKSKSEFITFDPIPSTDYSSLQTLFPNIKSQNLPVKNNPLKYKGQKQNYEWFDLCLISDLYQFNSSIYEELSNGYFDIWSFTDSLWSGKVNCLDQIKFINEKNFEDYFNRIRETSKDYIEIIQTKSNNFYDHKHKMPQCIINNLYRYDKVKEKLKNIKPNSEIDVIYLFEQCLKNVRQGSNPKIELINLFLRFTEYER